MEFKNMETEALEQRLAAILTECETEGADTDALLEECKGIKAELEARKASAANAAEIRKAVSEGIGNVIEEQKEERQMDNKEVRNSAEYMDAYAEYIKTGEKRAILTTNVTGGTIAVPDMVYDIVKTAWERDEIMALVNKTYIKGNFKVGFEVSSSPAAIHTEGDEDFAEEELVLGTVALTPQSIKKWIRISDEAYDLRGEAFVRYIYDELTYRIAKKAADVLLAAIVAAPATSSATAAGVPVVTASALAMGTIASAMGNLSGEAANPVAVMNRLTWSAFKAVQYANGFNADPFEGLRVIFNDSLPAFASATTGDTVVIVGDFYVGAMANYPNGEEITLKFDDLSEAENDLIKIVGRRYVGLGVVAPNAFVKINKA